MLRPRLFLLIGAIALLASCASAPPLAQNEGQTTQASIAASVPLSYEDYETVLRTYVNADGLVDYSALQANPQVLENFITQLGSVPSGTYAAWSQNEKIAFLINAYNAITLKSIIDQNPLKGSIKDIFGVWNFKKHTVMERSLTLDNIEHAILRKDFQEPRIHAALVCAAISCPPLRQEPYTGENLDAQLEDQTRKWLASSVGLQIDRTQNRVAISSIFNWFGEDWQVQYAAEGKFTGSAKERSVLNFISNYVDPEDKEYLEQGNYKLDYLNYDWSLNRQ